MDTIYTIGAPAAGLANLQRRRRLRAALAASSSVTSAAALQSVVGPLCLAHREAGALGLDTSDLDILVEAVEFVNGAQLRVYDILNRMPLLIGA